MAILAPPIIRVSGPAGAADPPVAGSEATGGLTHRWFDWDYKWEYLLRMFRDRWETFDIASAAIVLAVPVCADPSPADLVTQPRFFRTDAGGPYVLLPRIVFGSAYADMRLVPYAAAIFVLADPFQGGDARFPAGDLARDCRCRFHAWLGCDDRQHGDRRTRQAEQLKALDHIGLDRGWRCWSGTSASNGRSAAPIISARSRRSERRAYTNDHWPMLGSTLMKVRYPQPAGFSATRRKSCAIPAAGMRAGRPARRATTFRAKRSTICGWWICGRSRGAGRADCGPVWAATSSILLKKIPITEVGEEQRPATRRTASAPGR